MNTTDNKLTCSSKTKKDLKNSRLFALDKDSKQKLPNGNIIDWNRGLLKQIHLVNENYLEWIDHPKMNRCRLFDDEIMESLSYTYWWIVPVIYIPWSLLELNKSYNYDGFTHIPSIVLIYILGVITWTLFEYGVHRYAFHFEPTDPKYNALHFIGHGLHHITPSDEYRLVFPPIVSLPLAIFLRSLFYIILPIGIAGAYSAGFASGYAMYESVHYLSHHCPFGNYLQTRFKYHSAHHFNHAKKESLYGITSSFWDMVFGTL